MTLRGATILFFILWWRSTHFYFSPYGLRPLQTTNTLMTWKRPYLALGSPNCPCYSNGNETKLTLWAIFCCFHISHIVFNDHIVEKRLSDGRNFVNNSMFIPDLLQSVIRKVIACHPRAWIKRMLVNTGYNAPLKPRLPNRELKWTGTSRSQLPMTKTPALEQSRTGHFILYV